MLETRQHYEILDGLRGIAAIAVVIFHFMEIIVPDYKDSFVGHAYLAVDFFFCLSGFVIAYAYDNRLPVIGRAAFFKLRLIRLHPLVILGTVLGIVLFVLDPFSNLWTKYADRLAIMFVTSCLMIPYPVVHERFANLFHLNAPAWSLFWEYIANIVYAFILVRVGKKVLWALLTVGAVALFWQAHEAKFLGGVGFSGPTFWGGGIRAFYPFLAGILVYRMGYIIRSGVGFLATSVLLLIALMFPFSPAYNPIVEPLIVILYFPLLLALGAGTAPGSRVRKLCRLSGEISYPLYMVHYPFIWIFLSYVETYKPTLRQMGMITAVATILLIALAYGVLVFIDAPVRKYFRNRLVRSSSQTIEGN